MKANGIINFVFVTSASACLMGIVVKPKSFQKEELNLDYFNAKPVLTLDTPKVKEPLHFNFNDNKNLNPLTQPNSNLYLQNPENIKTKSPRDAVPVIIGISN